MKYVEQVLSVLKNMFGKTNLDNIQIFFKANKNEAEVYVNGKYWATYELDDINLPDLQDSKYIKK
jgi:hypothetical protein